MSEEPGGIPSARPEMAQAQVAAPTGFEHLTPRQIEVLRLLARGMTDAQIAEALFDAVVKYQEALKKPKAPVIGLGAR